MLKIEIADREIEWYVSDLFNCHSFALAIIQCFRNIDPLPIEYAPNSDLMLEKLIAEKATLITGNRYRLRKPIEANRLISYHYMLKYEPSRPVHSGIIASHKDQSWRQMFTGNYKVIERRQNQSSIYSYPLQFALATSDRGSGEPLVFCVW